MLKWCLSDAKVMVCLSRGILSADVDFGHLIKVISASFLHWKVIIIPFMMD